MKTIKILKHAGKVLKVRNGIIAEHVRHRNQMAVELSQTQAVVNQHIHDAVNHRLNAIQAVANHHKVHSPKPLDPLKRIRQREEQVLAKVSADGNVRTAVERQLRAQAKQAALDRAVFIDQVKRDLPEELWDETIDSYDRRVYESRDGGPS